MADCFTDHRNPELIEHTVLDMVRQRIYLALGYEDLNDHQQLRDDPLLAALVGKADPSGKDRPREQDKGHPLASPSTLNRMELSAATQDPADRYKRLASVNSRTPTERTRCFRVKKAGCMAN